jgi:hypothetical protein
MRIQSTIPRGRPLLEVDELAEIVKQKQAMKPIEKSYKALVEKLKQKNKSVLSGNKHILYFKEVSRKSVDTDLLTSAEKSEYARLVEKASVSKPSLSFDKIISK